MARPAQAHPAFDRAASAHSRAAATALKEQQIAIERATDQQQPAALAALYAERLKLIAPNVGPDEARLRSIEHTVSVFRNNNPRASLEDAKAAVMAAIAAKGRQP